MRKEIMSIREELKKPVEISLAKVKPNETLAPYTKVWREILWDLYRKQLEIAALANGWTENQKATKWVLALQGKGLEIL